jgi:hypothetical protein
MADGSDFDRRLREALHRETAELPLRIDAMTIRERLDRRSRLPRWLVPVALPVGAVIVLGAVLLNAFPGPGQEPITGGSAGELRPSTEPSPAPTAEPTPAATPHPADRSGAAVALGQDRLYVIGGRRGASGLESAVAFDGLTWTALPPLPDQRVNAAAAVTDDGRVLVFGGESPTGSLDSTLVLELGADAWAPGPALPVPAASMAAVAVDDRAYLFGGSTEGHERDVLVLDLAANEWHGGTPMPVALDDPVAASIGSDVFVLSGQVFLRYETQSGTWESAADPILVGSPRALAPADGRLWLVGGMQTPGDRYPGVAAFDPETALWMLTDERLPPGNTWLQVYPSGERLTVIGGHSAGITTTVVDIADR